MIRSDRRTAGLTALVILLTAGASGLQARETPRARIARAKGRIDAHRQAYVEGVTRFQDLFVADFLQGLPPGVELGPEETRMLGATFLFCVTRSAHANPEKGLDFLLDDAVERFFGTLPPDLSEAFGLPTGTVTRAGFSTVMKEAGKQFFGPVFEVVKKKGWSIGRAAPGALGVVLGMSGEVAGSGFGVWKEERAARADRQRVLKERHPARWRQLDELSREYLEFSAWEILVESVHPSRFDLTRSLVVAAAGVAGEALAAAAVVGTGGLAALAVPVIADFVSGEIAGAILDDVRDGPFDPATYDRTLVDETMKDIHAIQSLRRGTARENAETLGNLIKDFTRIQRRHLNAVEEHATRQVEIRDGILQRVRALAVAGVGDALAVLRPGWKHRITEVRRGLSPDLLPAGRFGQAYLRVAYSNDRTPATLGSRGQLVVRSRAPDLAGVEANIRALADELRAALEQDGKGTFALGSLAETAGLGAALRNQWEAAHIARVNSIMLGRVVTASEDRLGSQLAATWERFPRGFDDLLEADADRRFEIVGRLHGQREIEARSLSALLDAKALVIAALQVYEAQLGPLGLGKDGTRVAGNPATPSPDLRTDARWGADEDRIGSGAFGQSPLDDQQGDE